MSFWYLLTLIPALIAYAAICEEAREKRNHLIRQRKAGGLLYLPSKQFLFDRLNLLPEDNAQNTRHGERL